MQVRLIVSTVLSTIVFGLAFAAQPVIADEEPLTLIGTIVNWQYPKAKIGEAEMSDAATMNAKGDRTVASTISKTTMTTPDSVEKVVEFYKKLLKREPARRDRLGVKDAEGCSVIFSDDSKGRKFELHTILVNTNKFSTTIIISRAKDEMKTSITWKQYYKHLARK